jgi:iron complex transport system substrate-binding protein
MRSSAKNGCSTWWTGLTAELQSGAMRICSLLPSATEIIAELGLVDSLVGVSAECRWPATVVGKPVVTAARLDPAELTSAEIDEQVRRAVHDGDSLYAVDADLIDELQPDIIVTQDLCTVCAVSSEGLAGVCPVDAEVISLDPRTLDEVAGTVSLLARRLGAIARGEEIVLGMSQGVEATRRAVEGRPLRRVFVAEWIEPPFSAGHWVPEMVHAAGGTDVLGRAAEPSFATTWDDVLALEPELVVLAPCGFEAEDASERAGELELPCPAVAVDADSYYSRPAPRLADGVRQLGHLLHPDAVPDPGLPAYVLTPSRRQPSDGPRSERRASRAARR